MIKEKVLDYITEKAVNPGETIQFDWFIFRAVGQEGKVTNLETLDFMSMASFTTDFSRIEEIATSQSAALEKYGFQPLQCNLCQYATVSKSYKPSESSVFLNRQGSIEPNDSGWFVGLQDDPLDINNPGNLCRMSLYEISITDRRFLPYWLFPESSSVLFSAETATVDSPNSSG